MSDTNKGDFAETTAFERYGVKSSEKATGLSRPGLARSGHCGRIKLLRGYVSKSSAALNPLTITQLACERPRGRSRMSRTALRGPAHQLGVRMSMIIIISDNTNYYTICYGTWYS